MDLYVNLDHKAYKAAEKAMREFNETSHTSVEGFYHKSIRIPLGPNVEWEIHGPSVKAAEPTKKPAKKRVRRSLISEGRPSAGS